MTKDELIERALREENIFPPSVMDRHYGDRAEMTKAEIIVKSLEEKGMVPLSEQDAPCGDKIRYIPIVVAGLQRRLPDGKTATCGAFRGLNAGCCDSCHTSHPRYSMELANLPDGCKAWVCCSVKRAIFPGRHRELQERMRNSPFGEKVRGRPGDDDAPED